MATKSHYGVFSFFSGAGFLDLGFEKNGFEVAFVNEFHRPFAEAYIYSREKMEMPPPRFGVHVDSVEDYIGGEKAKLLSTYTSALRSEGKQIGFVGGPPCPDFSVAGKNKGSNGENGKLSRTYIDLIVKQKPDFFIFENVKGLYRTKKHREFFESLKVTLQDAGYYLSERLVNSLEYGAPQDRERIILFGFIPRKDCKNLELNWDLFKQYKVTKKSRNDLNIQRLQAEAGESDIPKELTVEHWFEKNNVTAHPNSSHRFTPRAGLAKFQSIQEGDDSKKSYKRLSRFKFSPTVAYGNNEVHLHPTEARRISVAEALSLQSLPKDFELPPNMTLSNMFKTIGNGVPFKLSDALAKTILYFMESNKHADNSKQLGKNYSKASEKSLV